MRPATLPNGILASSCNGSSVAGSPILGLARANVVRPTAVTAFSMWCTGHLVLESSFDHYPSRFQNRKGDQANDSCGRNQRGIANLPAEQNSKRRDANERRQPVANGNFPK